MIGIKLGVPAAAGVLLSVLVTALVLVSCSGGGGGAEAPQASIMLLHQVSDLGTVEVLVDGEVLRKVEPGELTPKLVLPTGSHSLELRNPGAATALISEEINFQAQTYLVAFIGASAGNTLEFWKVDAEPPELDGDEAAVEVVSLYDGTFQFDVWAGDLMLAQATELRTAYSFQAVAAGPITISIFNTGDEPGTDLPVKTEDITLTRGSATMVLLQTDPEGPGVVVQTVAVR